MLGNTMLYVTEEQDVFRWVATSYEDVEQEYQHQNRDANLQDHVGPGTETQNTTVIHS